MPYIENELDRLTVPVDRIESRAHAGAANAEFHREVRGPTAPEIFPDLSPAVWFSRRRACAARSGFRWGAQSAKAKFRSTKIIAGCAPHRVPDALRVTDDERTTPDPHYTYLSHNRSPTSGYLSEEGPPEAHFNL